MYVIITMLMSVLVGLGAFFAILEFTRRRARLGVRREREKRNEDAAKGKIIELGSSTIADDLFPLIKPYITPGDSLFVVGSDAFFAASRHGLLLIDGLRECMKRGATLTYIILAPDTYAENKDSDAVIKLRKLKEEFDDKFHLVFPGEDPSIDEIQLETIQKYHFLHPILLVRGDEPIAMWIEGYHEPASIYAYNVKFVSIEAWNNAELEQFNSYYEDIQRLTKRGDYKDVSQEILRYPFPPKAA